MRKYLSVIAAGIAADLIGFIFVFYAMDELDNYFISQSTRENMMILLVMGIISMIIGTIAEIIAARKINVINQQEAAAKSQNPMNLEKLLEGCDFQEGCDQKPFMRFKMSVSLPYMRTAEINKLIRYNMPGQGYVQESGMGAINWKKSEFMGDASQYISYEVNDGSLGISAWLYTGPTVEEGLCGTTLARLKGEMIDTLTMIKKEMISANVKKGGTGINPAPVPAPVRTVTPMAAASPVWTAAPVRETAPMPEPASAPSPVRTAAPTPEPAPMPTPVPDSIPVPGSVPEFKFCTECGTKMKYSDRFCSCCGHKSEI